MPDHAPFPPALRDAVLAWYAANGRLLPFRATSDPYAILVSEAMAQQTQAVRAGESWIRFMAQFPTVSALATATPADALRAWQGLGYNRRALNLWRAARQIVDRHGGVVPADLAALLSLPGVGPYTARAIAALAFGLPVGAVDTNVRRVLGRIVAGDAGPSLGAASLQEIADAAVPLDQPRVWTHALMDIGATLCRPRTPNCADCPARDWCRYAAASAVHAPRRRHVGADDRPVHTVDHGEPTVRAGRNPDALPQVGRAADGRAAGGRAAGGRAAGGRAVREAPIAFVDTSRWLRGRVVDRLRAAGPADWITIEGPIGGHDGAAVTTALHALAKDGLIEIDRASRGSTGTRARLPIS